MHGNFNMMSSDIIIGTFYLNIHLTLWLCQAHIGETIVQKNRGSGICRIDSVLLFPHNPKIAIHPDIRNIFFTHQIQILLGRSILVILRHNLRGLIGRNMEHDILVKVHTKTDEEHQYQNTEQHTDGPFNHDGAIFPFLSKSLSHLDSFSLQKILFLWHRSFSLQHPLQHFSYWSFFLRNNAFLRKHYFSS